MIERHDDHDQPAQEIDGIEPLARSGRILRDGTVSRIAVWHAQHLTGWPGELLQKKPFVARHPRLIRASLGGNDIGLTVSRSQDPFENKLRNPSEEPLSFWHSTPTTKRHGRICPCPPPWLVAFWAATTITELPIVGVFMDIP